MERSFKEITNCGNTTDIQLRSLCETYRKAIDILSNSDKTTNWITFETTIEQLLEAKRIMLLTYKTCSSSGIETVQDIAHYLNTQYILKRCRIDIRKELISVCEEAESNRLISSLKYHGDSVNCNTTVESTTEHGLTNDTSIDTLFEVGLLSKRAYHCCKNAGLLSLGGIILYWNKGLPHFYRLKNCGRKTVNELCGLCDRFKPLLSTIDTTTNDTIDENTNEQREDSDAAKEFFEIEFERLKSKLSVRSRHLCEDTWGSYRDMIPFLEYSYESFCKKFPGKKKSTSELYDMLQEFKSIYSSNCDISEEEISRLNHERLFPFLINRELDFVLSFKTEHGRYPMLYILSAYLSLSSDRTDALYAYKYGILTGEPHHNDEVASAFFVSRERVRQLIQKYHLNQSLEFASIPDWKYYIENAPLVLTKETSIYNEIAKEEMLENGFSAFVGLIGSVVNYKKIRRKGERIYIKAEYEEKAREILDKLTDILDARYSRDVRISLPSIVGSNRIYTSIARTFLKDIFNVTVDEDDTFEIKQSKVDICQELVEILDVIDYPVTLDELFMFFKDKYPEHKYEDASQLRPSILASDEIVAIGKSGMYGLSKWNMFTGSVRDCAYMILSQSTEPIPDEQLVAKLLEYFPNSNYKSLMSSLVSDPKERFAHYTDSTTGLMEHSSLTNKVLVRARMSFDNRLEDLKKFLSDYKRWPFASGGEDEASLARWIYNHTRRDALPGYDPEEAKQIENLQEEYAHYPHNCSEYEFLNLCGDFKIFLEKNYRLPEEESLNEQESELATWFRKAITKKEPYDDNRNRYLEELISYLKDYGFYF
ncbi:MAG: hypothetical protein NC115_05185 [Bacteroidales bacterium]|nr:hypothetical protein [Bacteroidales bacterium]